MLDYAAILQAGQDLVPDLQQQLMQRQEVQLRRDALEMLRQRQAAALDAERNAAAEKLAFERDLQAALQSKDPRAVPQLMIRYPKLAADIKPGFDALSEEAQRANLTRFGSIIMRGKSGDYEGAAKLLEDRIAAEKQAGNDTSEDEQAVALLRSGDPAQQQAAIGAVRLIAYAVAPKAYKDWTATFEPEDDKQSPFMQEYNDRVKQFGKAAADAWAATESDKFVSVDGVGVFRGSDLTGAGPLVGNPTQPGGGDPADPRRGVPAPQTGANGIPATLTPEQYNATVAAMGKAQTDAWMQQNGVTVSGGPVRVRSVQEAKALPKGTRYITPDGQEMIR